jgi:hypothetical protein
MPGFVLSPLQRRRALARGSFASFGRRRSCDSIAGRLSASSKVQSKMLTASGFKGLTHEAAEVPQGGIGYRYFGW